jgi:hypothetical protein
MLNARPPNLLDSCSIRAKNRVYIAVFGAGGTEPGVGVGDGVGSGGISPALNRGKSSSLIANL